MWKFVFNRKNRGHSSKRKKKLCVYVSDSISWIIGRSTCGQKNMPLIFRGSLHTRWRKITKREPANQRFSSVSSCLHNRYRSCWSTHKIHNAKHLGVRESWSSTSLVICRCLFLACNCFRFGSLISDAVVQCDVTGQCPCHGHVVGLQCDRCEDGYWNIVSGNGRKTEFQRVYLTGLFFLSHLILVCICTQNNFQLCASVEICVKLLILHWNPAVFHCHITCTEMIRELPTLLQNNMLKIK